MSITKKTRIFFKHLNFPQKTGNLVIMQQSKSSLLIRLLITKKVRHNFYKI